MRRPGSEGAAAIAGAACAADLDLLEALVTERVRLAVAVCDLSARDATLAARLARLLDVWSLAPRERSAVVQDMLRRAWARVARERGHAA